MDCFAGREARAENFSFGLGWRGDGRQIDVRENVLRSTEMRFLLTHPWETRPSLVVDTCPAIDTDAISRLRTVLHGLGCPNGLLFDDEQCIILRDSYSSMEPDSIVVEPERLPTGAVLASVPPDSLDERVARWLEVLTARWDVAMPLEPAIASPFIADIVPAASGSLLHALKGAA